MNKITNFGRGTTLNQALRELKENGLIEITRIINWTPEVYTFEYNVEVSK